MQKRILVALAMVITISLLAFTGCGKEKDKDKTNNDSSGSSEINSELALDPNHEHSYTEEITVEVSCEANGEKTFTCECGDSYKEEIPAVGHSLVADETSKVEPTCSKTGKEADSVCSVCGTRVAGADMATKEHSYGKFVYNNDATQTANGTQSRTCSTCGKVDTQTASGTKLPTTPASLRAITSISEIPIVGTITNSNSLYNEVRSGIESGKYEKIRYIASNGKEFCMWNVCIKDERNASTFGVSYYWFVAPTGTKFSDGYKFCNVSRMSADDVDPYLIAVGSNISSSINESMVNRDTRIPLAVRTINTADCPVNLYQIVETDTMISVWVESTNCGQAGIGTCGSFNCTGTCLRSQTLNQLEALRAQKRWTRMAGGENGRIKWNGNWLVNFYYMKYQTNEKELSQT